MHSLASSLTSRQLEFVPVQDALAEKGFALGGGWEYDHGSFDCALDEANTVFLRIPFDVEVGRLDSETANNEAQIRFGQPFVLRHLYNEGLDSEAQARTLGALFDQFSDPVDPDASIEPAWVEAAGRKLREVETIFPV
ncbi:YugN family protein [Cohnella faecalis]|uniref:YugN-like family protein n=1 Tax=Cohnella faecalis TaxID=2315694 RepID=A0A398CVI3_9BACL|nr:YugN family protein [Cohnella faecalis]RIE04064.1 hypothetical protein D3H35_08945 [Cohnella faecalis]RIE05319.1 hypothetical protein D3H35_01230 [Cohnella faecalis]RIE05485.1 hypothetical protein D3H35_00040 [Cohnella faecalis]RIE05488.1 hypothetical protein D3H35_00085 [Cohnella faecalis]